MLGRNPVNDVAVAVAERRASVRKVFCSTAHLLFPGRSPLTVRTLDINASGMSVVAALNLPTHLAGTIRFNLPVSTPAGSRIELQVKTAQCILSHHDGGFRIGLCFAAPAAEVVSLIRKFVAS